MLGGRPACYSEVYGFAEGASFFVLELDHRLDRRQVTNHRDEVSITSEKKELASQFHITGRPFIYICVAMTSAYVRCSTYVRCMPRESSRDMVVINIVKIHLSS